VTLDDYFTGQESSRRVFDVLAELVERLGDVDVRITKTQVAFRRRVGFAYAWVPEKHLGRPAAPLVLTVALRRRDRSPRWKEVVEPAKGRFTHHLELREPDEVDEEVAGWLREAWEAAG
jgi:hypothetical protein